MAVVEMTPERACLKFVGESLAGQNLARARYAIHARRVNAVEVHGMRHGAGVGELDADQVALGGAQRRAGDAAVVGPGREVHARRDLDLAIDRGDRELAQAATVRESRDLTRVEIGENVVRVETVARMVDVADRGHHMLVRGRVAIGEAKIGLRWHALAGQGLQ